MVGKNTALACSLRCSGLLWSVIPSRRERSRAGAWWQRSIGARVARERRAPTEPRNLGVRAGLHSTA